MIKATIQRTPYITEMTFPCSESQLSKWLDELRMNPEHLCPAATVTSVEPSELSALEDCEVNLDALNYLAKRMDGMSELERNQFFAVLTCDELEIGWGLKNIINLTFNLDRFTLIEDASNLEKVGRTHLLNIRGGIATSELENKEWLVEEGQKLLDSGKGIQTEYGLLFVNEGIKFEDFFEGTTFPSYLCDPNAVVSVAIDHAGMTETVELPCEDITIKKALLRLGADNIKSCHLAVNSFKDISGEWMNKFEEFEKMQDIFRLNLLLKTEDIRMVQPVSIFNKEVARVLGENDFTVSENKDCITVFSGGKEVAKIFDNGMMNALCNTSNGAHFEIKKIADTVNQYCSAYEKSAPLKADSLSDDYRCLAEFNGTVLAAKDTEYGFEFVTWDRTFDGKGVTQGNYYSDYLAAKENFVTRSGLINKDRLFGVEELENIRKCVNFTLENDGNLHFDEYDNLKKLNEKISESVSELQQSDTHEISSISKIEDEDDEDYGWG